MVLKMPNIADTPDLGIPEWFTKQTGIVRMKDLEISEIQKLINNLKQTKMTQVIREGEIVDSVDIWIKHFNKELIRRGE